MSRRSDRPGHRVLSELVDGNAKPYRQLMKRRNLIGD
jgi:hypothetical protein